MGRKTKGNFSDRVIRRVATILPGKNPPYLQLLFQVSHAAVAFDGVAGMAHQLQVADGIVAASRPGGDVVDGQYVERQFVLTAYAPAVLAGVQQFLVVAENLGLSLPKLS